MAEYWKSTPRYWCKFCEIYIRDTTVERKNHETSAKHQNNIQRSLRNLQNGQAKQQREQQQAKSEIARLNGLVGNKSAPATSTAASSEPAPPPKPTYTRSAPRNVDLDAHYRAQAQQLAAMGVEVPPELKSYVTGVGEWQVVSRRVVDDDAAPADLPAVNIKGVHKRKVEDDDEATLEGSTAVKRRNWGTSLKSYPGASVQEDDTTDLDVLLSGVGRKTDSAGNTTEPQSTKVEDDSDTAKDAKPEPIIVPAGTDVKQEDSESAVTAPPIIAFKKRKGKH